MFVCVCECVLERNRQDNMGQGRSGGYMRGCRNHNSVEKPRCVRVCVLWGRGSIETNRRNVMLESSNACEDGWQKERACVEKQLLLES